MKTLKERKVKNHGISHETYTSDAMNLCDSATAAINQQYNSETVDIPGGLYKQWANPKIHPLNNVYEHFCTSGVGRVGESARIAGNSIIQFGAGLVGATDIVKKSSNLAAAGKTDFKDMPAEILKAVHNRVDDAKDLALAKSTCASLQNQDELLKFATTIERYANIQLESLRNSYMYEAKTLNIQMTTFFIIINSIITFLLFY